MNYLPGKHDQGIGQFARKPILRYIFDMSAFSPRARIFLAIGVLIGGIIGLVVADFTKKNEYERTVLDFRLAATQRAALVRNSLMSPVLHLSVLGRFLENSEEVNEAEFAGFIAPWTAPSEASDFAVIETERNLTNIIWLKSGFFPPEASADVIRIAALSHANGKVAADIQAASGIEPARIILVEPVRSLNDRLRFVIAVYDLGVRIEQAVSPGAYWGLPTSILNPGGTDLLVYFHAPRLDASLGMPMDKPEAKPALSHSEAIVVAGVGLLIKVDASPAYMARRNRGLRFFIIPVSMLLSALLAFTIESLLRRADKADEAWQLATAELEHFFNLDLDLLCITDVNGRFLRVNPAWERTLGYGKNELDGLPYVDFVHPEDKEATNQATSRLGRHEAVEGFINRYRGKDGSWRTLEWRATALDQRIYAAARDVTERQDSENRLRQALSEKETLLREVHHRVKNNMQIISSMLNLQDSEQSDSHLSDAINDAQGRIRAMALVHEELYRTGDFSSIPFMDYAKSMAASYSCRMEDRTIQVTVEETNLALTMDLAIPCGLIINELLTNCMKYAFASVRNPEIRIALTTTATGLELSVADNGTGLADEFDPSTDSHLGLKLVSSLAAQIGGELRCENRQGARFFVRFSPDKSQYRHSDQQGAS